jgi:S-formylglutathione hydrolase FrmB
MAFLQAEIKSDFIRMDTSICAILPQDKPDKPACGAVLYLLHGRGQNARSWSRYSGVERYAEKYGAAVIMPEGNLSFYTDMCYGGAYLSYITGELPDICGRLFHIPTEPAHTYIAGLSMGGYGAMKCAFNRPELYEGCASFSAVTDIQWRVNESVGKEAGGRDLQAIFGVEPRITEQDDLFALAKTAAKAPKRPRLFIACGTEDIRYEQNLRLSNLLREQGYDHEFRKWAGDHDWDFWDLSAAKALDFFFAPLPA